TSRHNIFSSHIGKHMARNRTPLLTRLLQADQRLEIRAAEIEQDTQMLGVFNGSDPFIIFKAAILALERGGVAAAREATRPNDEKMQARRQRATTRNYYY